MKKQPLQDPKNRILPSGIPDLYDPTRSVLTKKEFEKALKINNGLYSRTADWIQFAYNIPYSRQAVKKRAEQNPRLLKSIRESVLDEAEASLNGLTQHVDPHIKFQAVKFMLKTLGKERGYVERQELTGKGDEPLISPSKIDYSQLSDEVLEAMNRARVKE